ncbi:MULTISPECIES: ABC transporter permease [Rathayibacter]|uniref:ABC transporter permease n=1 Tax=Rathayibacter TaxID=33886 RepID=UPI001FB22B3E|nr:MULTISPECIES: ABC transporter permease [Rathayibacter]MCJ1688324.1 ABC transporter permease [Rathayibacter sp. VKM Ac-2927]MCJ1697802.1 ABC transporter permease [Rathayibacter caricis]
MTTVSAVRTRTPRARPYRRRGNIAAVRILAPAIALAALLGIWQLAAEWGGMSASVLPSPVRVLTAGWADRDTIAEAAGATLQITLLGLVVAVLAAVVMASLLSFAAPLRMTFLPILIGAQSVPIIVLAPLFVIWFGFDAGPKIALVAIVSLLPLTISTLQGLQSADPDAALLLRSMGASRWQVFLRLRVFTALPHFITGLRIMTSFIVVSAIFSEYVGAKVGLGIYMQAQKNLFRTDLVFAAVFVSIAIGLALFALTYFLETLVMPWERRRKAAQR